ncbi:MAG: hypothetical protein U0637_02490 [Phycisphaerales bacterium]
MGMSNDVEWSFFGAWKLRLLIAIPLLAVGLWLGFRKKGETDHAVFERVQGMVRAAPSYAANTDYFDAVVKQCHEQVFEANYNMGTGRHDRTRFYEAEYMDDLFACMIQKFEADGASHIVPELRAIHDPGRL